MKTRFTPPEFIENNSPEEIQRRMMNSLPEGIDDTPGGFPWDFTFPTAIQKAELIQFHLVRTLMLMFPMWAWGDWLDRHAEMCGLTRRPAGRASGVLTVQGDSGIQIKTGSMFATPATEKDSSILFRVTEDAEIPAEGTVDVPVTAVSPGTKSNVPAGTVTLMAIPVKGIASATNKEAMTGGTDIEDDESLRERIQESNSAPISFVGNDSDYIRWAKEVVGVGSVVVIPEWDGPGTVKLVILDANGKPGNESILNQVYDHIVSPEDRKARLAPIGATVTVAAPETVSLTFSAVVVLDSDFSMETVQDGFAKNIRLYYEEAKQEEMLVYTQMAAVLSDTVGVDDYMDFRVNGETKNIPISQALYPETTEIHFKDGGVT